MPVCCLKSCRVSSYTVKRNNLQISFHAFPKDRAIRKKWLSFCGIPDRPNLYLCSNHFVRTDFGNIYRDDARCTLGRDAVPSVQTPEVPSEQSILTNRKEIVTELLQKYDEDKASVQTQNKPKGLCNTEKFVSVEVAGRVVKYCNVRSSVAIEKDSTEQPKIVPKLQQKYEDDTELMNIQDDPKSFCSAELLDVNEDDDGYSNNTARTRCVVPRCKNVLQEWMAPFPSNVMLQCRWKECIEVGSGRRLPNLESLGKHGAVCSMHFLGFNPADGSWYRQPTLFFRGEVVLEVEGCCLCSRIYIKDDMLEKNDCLKGSQTLEAVVTNIFGSAFNDKADAEYICEECVVKVDMARSFQRQIIKGKQELKRLRSKMAKEKICFHRSENQTNISFDEVELHSVLKIEQVDTKLEGLEVQTQIEVVEEILEETVIDAVDAYDPLNRTPSIQTDFPKKLTEKVPPIHKTKTQCEALAMPVRKILRGKTLREKLEKSRLKCYICGDCSESTDELLNHLMLIHTDQNELHCQECKIKFERAPECNTHLAKHDAEVRPYKCNHCPLRFALPVGRSQHAIRYHSDKPKQEIVKKPRLKNFMCTICGSTYRSQFDLNRHDKVQHKGETFVTCKTCKKPFASRRNLKRHLLIHRGELPYACKECGVSYRQSQALLNHMNENHNQGPPEYACPDCDARFMSHRRLMNHRKQHSKETATAPLASRSGGDTHNKVTCNVCDTHFNESIEILDHFQTQHAELELEHYPCSTCGELFFGKQALLIHSYSHSSKFACEICGRKHYNKVNLQVHRNMVHGIPVDGKYFDNCPHCNKKYPKGNILSRHLKTHFQGEWICELCKKRFTEKFQLRIHMRRHTGEKPLRCIGCNARFGDPASLSKHKKQCVPPTASKD